MRDGTVTQTHLATKWTRIHLVRKIVSLEKETRERTEAEDVNDKQSPVHTYTLWFIGCRLFFLVRRRIFKTFFWRLLSSWYRGFLATGTQACLRSGVHALCVLWTLYSMCKLLYVKYLHPQNARASMHTRHAHFSFSLSALLVSEELNETMILLNILTLL